MGKVCSFSTEDEAQAEPSELCVAKRSIETNSLIHPHCTSQLAWHYSGLLF